MSVKKLKNNAYGTLRRVKKKHQVKDHFCQKKEKIWCSNNHVIISGKVVKFC